MFGMKVVFIVGLSLAFASAQRPGGVTPLSGDDLVSATNVLNNSLEKLASGDGPNYKLGKVISASRQLVSGFKYVYEVELVSENNTKNCNVEIWSQPWLPNGNEVTFDCPDGKVVKRHN
ncbi:sarcocystatin-A-like [Drosophila sulfurigaster albostrigata]|uniref:sarcocystatin-A-like n=1 Tax=Drosophila sulfurigaster albostrigata TaxID=89887 RepID=UPI002D21A871|nr:sarcocystatin-A-like [Drosophila sulfurigaster albostrigata]